MIYRSAAGAAAVEQRFRELLRTWPVPNETLIVPTGEGDTFVVASGSTDAPPDDVLAALCLGETAMLDSYETERRLTATVSHATVHLLPESGHLLPDQTQTQTVLRFLCSPAGRNV
jgi:hypothetical protein